MMAPNLVMLPKQEEKTEQSNLGACVWWSLSGSIEYAKLQPAWEGAGLHADDCPTPPTPRLALNLAAHAAARGARRFAQAMDEEGHWVVAERMEASDDGVRKNTWEELLQVRLVETPEGAEIEQVSGRDDLFAVAKAHFYATMVDWPSTSVSEWLPRFIASRCDGIGLRKAGGIFYVPPAKLDYFRAVRAVVHAVSGHHITLMPAAEQSEDAVQEILRGLEAEVERCREEALEECDSPRKATIRRKKLADMVAKLDRYESALDVSADALHARLIEADRTLSLLALAGSNDS